MIEWLAEQIINKSTNINGNETTYTIATEFLKSLSDNEENYREQVKQLNELLISNNCIDLIK